VLASGRNVNVLVLDTEVYSNTGGQASKSTPRGAVAKFAAGGKPMSKKDLGLHAINYGNVYVAAVAMGANDAHTVGHSWKRVLRRPSIIIAYSHCIAHGIDMTRGMNNQKAAVQSGAFPIYRFDPRLIAEGKNPFLLDSSRVHPDQGLHVHGDAVQDARAEPAGSARHLLELAQNDAYARYNMYQRSPI